MEKRIIGLSTLDITEKEIQYVTDVLRSGKISPGPIQQKFEQYVAKAHGHKYATFCNSGQSALHLSFETLKLLNPDLTTVVCPATTYISTLHAAWNSNLQVRLVDVDINTYNVKTPVELEDHEIFCPVNLMGLSVTELSADDFRKHYPRNFIVEDNCESVFAPNTGYGDLMCLSFYTAHHITTSSGGMVCTNRQDMDDIVKSLCNHGRTNPQDLYAANRNESYDKSKKFVFDKVAFSFKLGDFNAALGLAQAERHKEIISKNIEVAHKLTKALSKYQDYLQLPLLKNNIFMNYPIVCKPGVNKYKLVNHLNEYCIETRDLMPIVDQPIVIKKLNPNLVHFPVARYLCDNGFYIGCHKDITDVDINYIEEVFGTFKWK